MLFAHKTLVYESRNREEWKLVREALHNAGLRPRAGHTEETPPCAGCGAKIDPRASGGKYDPETYYIRVRDGDEPRARNVLESLKNMPTEEDKR